MDQIRIDAHNFLPNLADETKEGSEVTQKKIRSQRKTSVQSGHCLRGQPEFCHPFHQWSVRGAHNHRIEAAAIKPRQNQQQQAFGAADLSSVVVKKNLHLSKQKTGDRRQNSEGPEHLITDSCLLFSVFCFLSLPVPFCFSQRIET